MRFCLIALFLVSSFVQAQSLDVIFNGNKNNQSKFEFELIKDVIALHQIKFNRKFKVNYIGLKSFKNVFKRFNTSKADESIAIYSISINKDRKKTYDFTIPYISNQHYLLSDHFVDLKSKKIHRVAFLTGSIYEKVLNQMDKSLYKPVPYTSTVKATKDLTNKKVDLIMGDYFTAKTYKLKTVREIKELDKNDMGILLRKRSALTKEFNTILLDYLGSPDYKKLKNKYF